MTLSKILKKCSRSGHSISTCPLKRYTKRREKASIQKQNFNQAMKGNQNLPNKQITSNNMTGLRRSNIVLEVTVENTGII